MGSVWWRHRDLGPSRQWKHTSHGWSKNIQVHNLLDYCNWTVWTVFLSWSVWSISMQVGDQGENVSFRENVLNLRGIKPSGLWEKSIFWLKDINYMFFFYFFYLSNFFKSCCARGFFPLQWLSCLKSDWIWCFKNRLCLSRFLLPSRLPTFPRLSPSLFSFLVPSP